MAKRRKSRSKTVTKHRTVRRLKSGAKRVCKCRTVRKK